MARLSDADQGGLPVPRFDSCGADRARPGALPRSRAAHARATPPRYSGMAEFLLQVADDRAGAVSGARSVHSAHEAEEHSAALEGRRVDYTFGAGVLRLGHSSCGDGHLARPGLRRDSRPRLSKPSAARQLLASEGRAGRPSLHELFIQVVRLLQPALHLIVYIGL